MVEQPCTLFPFIQSVQQNLSRNKVKSQLVHRQVLVNGLPVTQFDAPLQTGDEVVVLSGKGREMLRHPMLRIVWEDDDLIVIDKRNGLLSMGTDKERTKTAYHILSDYLKREDPRNRLFILHRLDRETSGLMMFAKNQQVQELLQRHWSEWVTDRRYVAVAEGQFPQREGVIEAALSQNRQCKMFVDGAGEHAVTRYRVLSQGETYALVELTLDTGKKNQIRAHLEYLGHPVAGDKKYGAHGNPGGRVCLHARVLQFRHPITGQEMLFSTRVPELFESIVARRKGHY